MRSSTTSTRGRSRRSSSLSSAALFDAGGSGGSLLLLLAALSTAEGVASLFQFVVAVSRLAPSPSPSSLALDRLSLAVTLLELEEDCQRWSICRNQTTRWRPEQSSSSAPPLLSCPIDDDIG
jgi:hypothetical protein